MEVIGPRLGDHLDRHAGVEALLGVLVRLDAEFLDQLGGRARFVPQSLMPVDAALMTVGVVADRVALGSFISNAVNGAFVPIPGRSEDHPGQGIDQGHGLTNEEVHLDGQDFQHFRILLVGHGRVGGLDQLCLARDGHRFGHLTNGQDNVHRQSRIRRHSLPGYNCRLETGQRRRDIVSPLDVQSLDGVKAEIVGHRFFL